MRFTLCPGDTRKNFISKDFLHLWGNERGIANTLKPRSRWHQLYPEQFKSIYNALFSRGGPDERDELNTFSFTMTLCPSNKEMNFSFDCGYPPQSQDVSPLSYCFLLISEPVTVWKDSEAELFLYFCLLYYKACVWSLSQVPAAKFLNSELRDRNVFVIHSRSSDHIRVYVNEAAPEGPRPTAGEGPVVLERPTKWWEGWDSEPRLWGASWPHWCVWRARCPDSKGKAHESSESKTLPDLALYVFSFG